MRKNTLLILLLLPAFAFSQNVGRFGYVFAMDSLRLKAIVDSISIDSAFASASNRKLATTYAVKSYADRHLGSRDASTAAPSSGDVWKWNGSQWAPAADATGGGGVSDGDKGDIEVTGSGTVWTVDTSAITNIKIDANAIDSTKIVNGGVSVLDLGQHGASAGQVLKWNGTQWLPATDSINAGTLTGSGTSGQVAYWNGTSSLTGENAFLYNATTDALSIGATNAVSLTNSALTTATSFTVGGSNNSLTIGGSGGGVTISNNSTNNIAIHNSVNGTGATTGIVFGNAISFAQTGGTRNYINFNWGFAPTSGTAVHNQLAFTGTFNQTGGANGITRGIFLNQTITAVADFRALEIAANGSNVKGLYQSGPTAINNLAGNTRVGSTSTPARTLDVTGELRVSDLTTDNPTGLVGADNDGDFAAVKLGTGLSLSNDTLNATATGTVTGTATAGQVTYWSGTSSITGESGFEYDATNNRLGINKTSPAVALDIQQANASDGVRIQTDGTLDQDVWGLQLVGTATGPYTQRGRIGLDVYSNAGVSPQGQAFVFNLATDASGTTNPLLLYTNQAIFNNASEFTLANNTGRLRLEASATGGLYTTKNLLVTSSSYTTADTSTRLRVVGRTNGTATFPARFFDGGNGLIMAIRDDKRVGINASTIDAALHTNGLGSTSSTYGLIVTNSTTTTSTASLVVRDDNRVGIRTNAPQAPLNVVGTGTTSSTTALLVEGSGGQDNLNVRDDGVNIGQGFAMASSAPTIAFGNAAGTGPTNDLCTGGGNGFWLNFTTGTSPTTNASIFTATLPKSYPNGVVATWSCGDTDCLDEAADIYISGTGNNSVTLSTRGTLTASTSYSIYVTCFGY